MLARLFTPCPVLSCDLLARQDWAEESAPPSLVNHLSRFSGLSDVQVWVGYLYRLATDESDTGHGVKSRANIFGDVMSDVGTVPDVRRVTFLKVYLSKNTFVLLLAVCKHGIVRLCDLLARQDWAEESAPPSLVNHLSPFSGLFDVQVWVGYLCRLATDESDATKR